MAWLVPTRAGRYTFHVAGKVRGQTIDLTSTCSDATFECVVDAAEVQFPAKDPSAGQLADRLNRGLPRAEQAMEAARSARRIGFGAIVVAGLALVAAMGWGCEKFVRAFVCASGLALSLP